MKKLLLLAVFFNALTWQALIPIFQYPDEQSHFAQVQDFAEIGKIPQGGLDVSSELVKAELVLSTARDGLGNNSYTYHPQYNIEYSNSYYGLNEAQINSTGKTERRIFVAREATQNPPAYYFVGSIFYKLSYSAGIISRIYTVRVFSLILFTTTILAAFYFSKIIFESEEEQLVYTSALAFTPMFVFTSTGILPDPLTNLLFLITLIFCFLTINKGIKMLYLFALALLVVIGSLTRQQYLILVPVIALTIIYRLIISNKDRKLIGLIISPFILIAILSYFVPQLSYLHRFAAPEVGRPDIKLLFSGKLLEYLKFQAHQLYSQTLPWYWGVYRWLSYSVPHIYYQIINRILLISAIGLVVKIILNLKNKNARDLKNIIFLITFSLIYALILIAWDFFFFAKHGFSFGIQGRYFFPMIFAHFALIIIGLTYLLKLVAAKYIKYFYFAVILVFILFNNLSLFHLASTYYETKSITGFIIQASQYKPVFLKGTGITLLISISVISQVMFIIASGKKLLITKSSNNQNL